MNYKFLLSERFFVIVVAIIVLIFNTIPYVFQSMHNPPDKTYVGSFPIIIDKPVYLSAMSQGAEGNWLFAYNYTTEPHERTFIYSFYIFLGHISALLHLSPEVIFFIGRFIFGLILIITIIYLIRYFVNDSNQRKIAYLLVFFSSGIGWLTQNADSPDLWIPDFMPMVRFSYFPHMVLANILLILIVWSFYKSCIDKKFKLALLAGFLGFILNIVLPFHSFTVYSLLSAFVLLNFVIKRSLDKTYLKNILAFLAISLPSFLYMVYLGISDPFWKEVSKFNSLATSDISTVLSGYGFILIFAAIGIYTLYENKNQHFQILFLWIAISFVLAYLPFIPMQRRALETGSYIPIAIVASFGVSAIYGYLKAKNQEYAIPRLMLMTVVIMPFMLLGNANSWLKFAEVATNKEDLSYYMPNENIEAMQWLKQNSAPNDVVLSSYFNGNIIPYYGGNTVYLGHGLMTLNFRAKAGEIIDIFKGKYSSEKLYDFLETKKITFIFFSDEEKEISEFKFDPEQYDFLKKVYRNNKVNIYKFETQE